MASHDIRVEFVMVREVWDVASLFALMFLAFVCWRRLPLGLRGRRFRRLIRPLELRLVVDRMHAIVHLSDFLLKALRKGKGCFRQRHVDLRVLQRVSQKLLDRELSRPGLLRQLSHFAMRLLV